MTKREYAQLSPHFNEREFACHHCGEVKIEPRLVQSLEALRGALGNKPMRILSGYRCPTHNKAVRGAQDSQHMKGTAADVVVDGVHPDKVADTAETIGFGGIGRYDGFTHVDVRPNKARWDERTREEVKRGG